MTLKDDERQDPPISADALDALGIVTLEEYETLKSLTKRISAHVKAELAKKDLELYDIKLEFGRDKETGRVMLIDEISGGNMRVFSGGESLQPMALESLLFS